MSHGFYDKWQSLQNGPIDRAIDTVRKATVADVSLALNKIPLSSRGFLSLLSEAADEKIDLIENAARDLTRQRFGRTVNLYIPLYLANYCINNCAYCWFRIDNQFERKLLTMEEAEAEGSRLYDEGYRSVLLVAGEDKSKVTVDYLEDAIRLMKKIGFVFVGIETQTLTEDEYARLGAAGLDSVTVYQETYDRDIYEQVHPTGPKKDFQWRINAAGRAASAGIRSVGIGSLLGLGDFHREAIMLASHAKYLQKQYWQTMISISFPRIHSVPEGFTVTREVTDNELTRFVFAMRLAFPDSMLTLSTREAPTLRDKLFGAGINQVSAGSKTSPGGYSEDGGGEQFPVVDDRTPLEVVEAIRENGLEWVWKDWDNNLKPVGQTR